MESSIEVILVLRLNLWVLSVEKTHEKPNGREKLREDDTRSEEVCAA